MKENKKRLNFLKNTDAKSKNTGSRVGQSNMVREADRIIRSVASRELSKRRDRSNAGGFLLPFFLGMITTLGASLILYFVLVNL